MPKPVLTRPLAAPAWPGAMSIGSAQIVEFVSSRKKNAAARLDGGDHQRVREQSSGSRQTSEAVSPATSGRRRASTGPRAAEQLVGQPAAGEVAGDAREQHQARVEGEPARA